MRSLVILLLWLKAALSFSQEDASDCKDHPYFPRMKNTSISSCVQIFEKTPIPVSADKSETREGLKTDIDYAFNGEGGPSFSEIVKFYESIVLQKFSGKKIFSGSDAVTFSGKASGKSLWLVVSDQSNMAPGNYGLLVLEAENVKQELIAGDLGDALNRSGQANLYLNFESGKSDLKPELQKQLNQVVLMMKQHPFIKLSIEAHTDNSMNAQQSQTVSEARAKAIMGYLNSKGIGKFRLTTKGFGQSKPVSDNNSEEGKMRNNRVELVRKN